MLLSVFNSLSDLSFATVVFSAAEAVLVTVAAVDELSSLLPQPVITLANDVETASTAIKSATESLFALCFELFIKSFLI